LYVQLEAIPVLELLDANETDEIVRLDALLGIVVLHRFDPFVLVLDVNLISKAAREGLQTRKTPVHGGLNRGKGKVCLLGHLHSSGHPAHPGLVHQHVAHQGALRHEGSVADQALQRLLLGCLGGTHRGYAYAGGKDNAWGLYKRDSVMQLLGAGHPRHPGHSCILIDCRQSGRIVDVLLRLL